MAQERKKRRIVLTSILKPVDDTRMFEKMGVSLAQKGDFDVFIVAFPSSSKPVYEGIHFISLRPFVRWGFSRLLARWQVFRKAWQLKPSILIFNTHELILPAVILKVFMDVKIIYDVRENYYRNILHSESFPWIIRLPVALLVRFKEKLFAPAIDHFFLAEKGYENELRFHRGGWSVIENKAAAIPERERPKKDPEKIRLLFSGTLAESTGVFQAIELAKKLRSLDHAIHLTLVGYAAMHRVRERLTEEVKANPWITLIGVDTLVPHPTVIEAIHNSDAGILSYPSSHHTSNSHPTKLFEYLNAGLPIILQDRWPWIERFAGCQPFIIYDSAKPDFPSLLKALKTQSFYSQKAQDVTWASEEPRFIAALNS